MSPGRRFNRARRLLPSPSIPILVYHQIAAIPADRDPERIATPPSLFERQMRHLHRAGFTTAGLDEVAAWVAGGRRPAGRRVAITFDDGYRDGHTHAFPVLRRFGFTATFFLVTGLIGGRGDGRGGVRGECLDLAGIREMAAAGIDFQSHSRTHADLTRLSAPELRREVEGSKADLEERLGRAVRYFAYPRGLFDERVKAAVASAGYAAACAVFQGGRDRFEIERLMVSRRDGAAAFKLKASPWGTWMRTILHTIRKPQVAAGVAYG